MIMKQVIRITVRIMKRHRFRFIENLDEVDLLFDKVPTREQLVEATRHYITDQGILSPIGLKFMEIVKDGDTDLKVGRIIHCRDGLIYVDSTLMFDETKEEPL